MAGGGSEFVLNIDVRTNPIGAFCCFGLCLILFFKKKLYVKSFMWFWIAFLLFWSIYHISADRIVRFLPYIYVPLYFLTAYTLVNIFKENLFYRIAQVVSMLTLIDLVFWGIQNLVGVRIMTALGFLATNQGTSTISYLLYSVSSKSYEGLGLFNLQRNCGFAWEPGRYASICVIAIFCNMMVNQSLSWYKNKSFYVLVAGIFTTFSTTGYMALLVLLGLRYLFSVKQLSIKHVLGIACMAVALPFIMGLPFMREKITDRSDTDSFVTNNQNHLKQKILSDKNFTVDRFEGIMLSLYDIKDSPIFGYGLNGENSWCQRNISPNIRISNGITKVFAEFGIPLSILLFFLMIINSIKLRKKYHLCRNSFFLIYLTLNISYDFTTAPLFIALYMNTFMLDQSIKQVNISKLMLHLNDRYRSGKTMRKIST